jgi:hypothetical protein
MMRTWRTLKQRGMQRNKKFGLFTKPSMFFFHKIQGHAFSLFVHRAFPGAQAASFAMVVIDMVNLFSGFSGFCQPVF